jgi:hypothetical protein
MQQILLACCTVSRQLNVYTGSGFSVPYSFSAMLVIHSCSPLAEKLHEAYNSSGAYPVYKNIVRFDGDHNHPRPSFFYSSVCCFFHQQLKLEVVLLPGHTVRWEALQN